MDAGVWERGGVDSSQVCISLDTYSCSAAFTSGGKVEASIVNGGDP